MDLFIDGIGLSITILVEVVIKSPINANIMQKNGYILFVM